MPKNFSTGERVRLLSGFRAGKHGIIVPPRGSVRNDPNLIVVQMDEDEPNMQQLVDLSFELVERLQSLPVPPWAPPISLRKTCELHERIIGFCKRSALGSVKNMNVTSLYVLIWHIWNKRLPLEPNDVWNMLEAHGVPIRWRRRIIDIIKHCMSLLILVCGKKPIKKFRVEPLEVTISPKYGFSE